MFRCLNCGKEFDDAKIITEPHGERHGVCPNCSSSNFNEWDPQIEKSEVAATLLEVIAATNRYIDNVKDLFGHLATNADLDVIYGLAEELIEEMYDEFAAPAIVNAIRNMRTNNDIHRVLACLTGV